MFIILPIFLIAFLSLRNLTSVWTFVKLFFLGDFLLKWQNRKYFCTLINGSFTHNGHILRSNIFLQFPETST